MDLDHLWSRYFVVEDVHGKQTAVQIEMVDCNPQLVSMFGIIGYVHRWCNRSVSSR